jgi:hypothetical protein
MSKTVEQRMGSIVRRTKINPDSSTSAADPVVRISQSDRSRSYYDESNVLPDLIVDACPLGCTPKCDKSWINQHFVHRIICKCRCHHKRKLLRSEVKN